MSRCRRCLLLPFTVLFALHAALLLLLLFLKYCGGRRRNWSSRVRHVGGTVGFVEEVHCARGQLIRKGQISTFACLFKAKAKNRSACRRSASLDIVALSSADCSLLMLRAGSGNWVGSAEASH